MAYLSTQRRPGTSAPGDGSRTITITDAAPLEDGGSNAGDPAPVGALHLRAGPRRTRQRVVWDEDVVDNEGCGRKSSKICCIYHKPKNYDESSSEEDSSDSDSDSDYDARARARRNHLHQHQHPHPHPHPGGAAGGASVAQRSPQIGTIQLDETAEPNAYEMVPSGKKGKGKRKSG
ncbi:phosphatase inhibitor-domain-containing protein [Mycena belliarum]|uniref:Type 1 phosphatases regulator n=1 Tax=Mycena belliarum TaxID=1033014 RepID=A0AAD6TWA9_9AGAR|nr:phosphatase inhibitor-domain-containing protein [Mycena belliae]